VVCLDVIDVNNVMSTYAVRRRSDRLEAREKAPPRVVDISMNGVDNNSWAAFGGPTPPVDLQIVCEPEEGMRQLLAAVRKKLERDAGSHKRITARKEKLADRHAKLRAAQTKKAREGWDASPIKVERMIHEVYQ
ncbi:MAG: hypothetical protein RIM80_06685, partial [Alphaproteobacteria bacterium]